MQQDMMVKGKKNIKKIVAGLLLVTFVAGIIVSYIVGIRVHVGQELVSFKPPLICFMIHENMDDESIKKKILENPELLHETLENPVLSCRTPLLAAIGYERIDLAKFMINKGASTKDCRQILQDYGVEKYVKIYDEIIQSQTVMANKSLNQ